ncbi:hypothetical protein [Tepidimicrobium xylanilyticum]|uniref:Uncharacterized protein n=1 Tax=Tepidimicrobium xylanilyticum TaxID=1123352 RepID=A0A1H2XHR5_9FIRM|nr:hypothetical protein [Tepidimicrobium xylanilyticum]GMG97508.1 hypothetical protein EN5CB1_23340 [Tepidimicrobium xylanilyticum]SDW92423.1 hypothetical protein SAMN05660923_01446 [Tepidimicrobium xylanilyticum]
MSEEAVIFIFRKILIPFSILFSFYRVYKNKKVTLRTMFSYVLYLYLVFSKTYPSSHRIHYDIIDKLLILVLYPIGFLKLSLSFFKVKTEDIDKEKNKYIAILIFFVIVEFLFIFNIF